MPIDNPERSWLEKVIVLVVMLVVAGLVIGNIYYQNKAGEQKALFYQLQILRNSLNLYKLVKEENPRSLEDLVMGTYKFPGDDVTRKFVDNIPLSKAGTVLDPFGNPYTYEPRTGWIKSSTSGYSFW